MRLTIFMTTLMYVMMSLHNTVYAADFLFEQTASGATLNDGTLTLTGVAEDVTYFSDRPVRVAGRISTDEFLTFYEPNGTFSGVCVFHASVCVQLFWGTHARSAFRENER